MKPYVGKEFEALKMRYDDQVALLRFMTTFDFQIFGGFLTLQLALGSWLAAHPISSVLVQLGVLLIDAVAALLSAKLLHNQHSRRQEVQATIRNINLALGFEEPGAYLESQSLNPAYTRRLWFKWYMVGIAASYVGMLLIVFGR
ncbi:MAG: hypothetical protein KF740_13975 [Ramlibacter sp.]|nr:hypothetical protein [Ramlibacter sp.]